MKNKTLDDWEIATQRLAEYFANKYFGVESEMWWVADQVGGVLSINDYFFNLEKMIDFLKYKYSKKDMFAYYWYELECYDKNHIVICIRDWKHIVHEKIQTK